jgi:hypothetical protein
LDDNLELARSLWDRDSLLVDLDIEYVNFDFPAEPYLDLNCKSAQEQQICFFSLGRSLRAEQQSPGRGSYRYNLGRARSGSKDANFAHRDR